MRKEKNVEPLFILFNTPEEREGQNITPQVEVLVRNYKYLILGFDKWVTVPQLDKEFSTPEFYWDDIKTRVTTAQDKLEQKWESKDNISFVEGNPENSSVMFFYEQKLLFWYTMANNQDMINQFASLSRQDRRRMERTIKLPILPIWVRIAYVPRLIMEYNQHMMRFLELKHKV